MNVYIYLIYYSSYKSIYVYFLILIFLPEERFKLKFLNPIDTFFQNALLCSTWLYTSIENKKQCTKRYINELNGHILAQV
jgi:hypothetical protein